MKTLIIGLISGAVCFTIEHVLGFFIDSSIHEAIGSAVCHFHGD